MLHVPIFGQKQRAWLLSLALALTACNFGAPAPTQGSAGTSDTRTHGLNSYYLDADGRIVYAGLAASIDGTLSAQHPDAREVGWYGFLDVDHDADYQFTFSAGVQLLIDNQSVGAGSAVHLAKGRQYAFKVRLAASSHPAAQVQWSDTQSAAQSIPNVRLSPASLISAAAITTAPTLPFPLLAVDFEKPNVATFPAVWAAGLSSFQEGVNPTIDGSGSDPYWKPSDYAAAFTSDGNASAGALKLAPGQEYSFYTSEMDVLRASQLLKSGATYEVSAMIKGSIPATCTAELLEPAITLKSASTAAANVYTRFNETFVYTGKPTGLNVRLRNTGTSACQFDDVKINWVADVQNLPDVSYNLLRDGNFDLQQGTVPYWDFPNSSFDLNSMTVTPGAGGSGKALGFQNATGKIIANQRITSGQLYPNTRYVLQAKFRSAGDFCAVVIRSGKQRTILSTLSAPGSTDWTSAKVLYTTSAIPEDLDIEPHLGQAAGVATCAVDDLTFGPEKIATPVVAPDPSNPDATPSTVVADINPTVTKPAYFSGNEASFQATTQDDTAQYLWDFGDGSQALGSDAVHTYDLPGQYTAKLTVQDATGQVTTQTYPISVMPDIHDMPSARAVQLGQPTILDVKYPAAGLTYEWAVDGGSTPIPAAGTAGKVSALATGSGQTLPGSQATLTLDKPGFHDITLTIYDKRSGVDVNGQPVVLAQQDTRVNVIVQRPVAKILAASAGGTNAYTINFDAQFSRFDSHTSLTYSWDFGDGTTGTGLNPSHTYAQAGRYPVALHVVDSYGQVDDAHKIVLTYQVFDTGALNFIKGQFDTSTGGAVCPPGFPTCSSSVNTPSGVGLAAQNLKAAQATSQDPVIRAAFAAAQNRIDTSLVMAAGNGRRSSNTLTAARITGPDADLYESHHPYVLTDSMPGFELTSAGEVSPGNAGPNIASLAINGVSVPIGTAWNTANCRLHYPNSTDFSQVCDLLLNRNTLNYVRSGNNKYVITQNDTLGDSSISTLDYNIDIPFIHELRVPHVNVNIIPDTQLDDTNVHEWSFNNNGIDEMVAQINVRSSDITPDGYVPMTVPVYAVDAQGKIQSDVSGEFNTYFTNTSLKSISREGVMYHGRTEVLVYVPIAQFADGVTKFDLTDMIVSANGVCPTGWNDNYSKAGHWVKGCQRLKASHATPVGAVVSSLGTASLGTLSLTSQQLQAQGFTWGEIRAWVGSVDTKLFNAINYGKTAISRLSMDKLLRAYDGSTVSIVIGLVPFVGDSIDLLQQAYNVASGKGADPVITVFAAAGLAVDAFSAVGGEGFTAIKSVYKISKGLKALGGGVLAESVAASVKRLASSGQKPLPVISDLLDQFGLIGKVMLKDGWEGVKTLDIFATGLKGLNAACPIAALSLTAQSCTPVDVINVVRKLTKVMFTTPLSRSDFYKQLMRICCSTVYGGGPILGAEKLIQKAMNVDTIQAVGDRISKLKGIYFEAKAADLLRGIGYKNLEFLEDGRFLAGRESDLLGEDPKGIVRLFEIKGSGSFPSASQQDLIAKAAAGATQELGKSVVPTIFAVGRKNISSKVLGFCRSKGIDVLSADGKTILNP